MNQIQKKNTRKTKPQRKHVQNRKKMNFRKSIARKVNWCSSFFKSCVYASVT
jgi:hypothetical protein